MTLFNKIQKAYQTFLSHFKQLGNLKIDILSKEDELEAMQFKILFPMNLN